jgi:hypothetical protein
LVRSLEGFGGARPPSSRSIAISLTLNVTSGPSGTTGWGDVEEAVSRELVRRLRYLVRRRVLLSTFHGWEREGPSLTVLGVLL